MPHAICMEGTGYYRNGFEKIFKLTYRIMQIGVHDEMQ